MLAFHKQLEKQATVLIHKTELLKKRSQRVLVYNAALLTVYGFQVAVPVVLGILLGYFLDRQVPVDHLSWTFNLVILAFVVGFYNANHWLYKMLHSQKKSLEKGGKECHK